MTSESADRSPMLEKCTPGDWNYVGDHVVGVVGDCGCQTSRFEPLEVSGDWAAYPDRAHESHDVVKPIFEDELPEGVTMEEHMANCKLIAAAKDLLKACKETLAEMRAYNAESEFDESCPMKPTFDQLKAAIAKALGEETANV